MLVENKHNNFDIELSPEQEKIETELKFTPVDPEFFAVFAHQYEPKYIHQTYLSHPSEPFSLRLRETKYKDELRYSAALKSRQHVSESGVTRLETPTNISKATYDAYMKHGVYADLYKRRIEPVPGVSIDLIDGWDMPIIEIEDIEINEEAQLFYEMYKDQLVNRSGEQVVDNEHIAHVLNGIDTEKSIQKELSAEHIVDEINAYLRIGYKQLVIGVSGRSGSGKSTIARQVQTLLAFTTQTPSVILSSDDYHVGKSYLESHYEKPWKNWDSVVVYNTAELANDIQRLKNGESVGKRRFDFTTEEPCIEDIVLPHDIIIVEGIHSGSSDLDQVRNLYFELDTPLATCIGRDLSRLRGGTRPNESIGSPEERMLYQLEVAEPTYWSKEAPARNHWSASVRPIGRSALK